MVVGDQAAWHQNPEEGPAVIEAWKDCVGERMNCIDTAQGDSSGESGVICVRFFKGMPRDLFIM
jgi:hypothetical protein